MLKVIQKQTYILMLVCLGFLAFAGVNGGVYADNHTNSTSLTEETKVSADVDQVLNVSLSSNLLELYLDPSDINADNANTSISVSTNNDTGYYMTVSSETTDLINTSDATKTIPTISGQSEWSPWSSSSEVNRWAFILGNTGYRPFVSGAEIARSDTAVDRDYTRIGFSAKIDYSQPAGVYKIDLDFLAVANPTIMAIQDLEGAYCTDTPLIVMDARDGEEYTVQRLADGKCWMLDNLRLDPTSVPLGALKGRTNASDDALRSLKNGNGTSPYSTGGVETTSQYFTGSYTTPLVITDHKDTKVNDTPGLGSGKVGVFYNFCAASAGAYCYNTGNTDNAAADICPAGWKIPSGLGNGDYKALYDALATSESEPENIRKFIAALSFPLAGRDGSQYLGEQGSLWTSTISSSSQMYVTQIDSYPGLNFYEDKERDTARPVRCVRKVDISSAGYLQSITPQLWADADADVVYTLKDKRDNKEYKVSKLKDGNLWMLDNLRLDLTTVPLETLKGNTNATDESLTYLKNGGGNDPYPATGVTVTSDNSSSNFIPYIITKLENTIKDTVPGFGSGKLGIYYNACAVSAGSSCRSDGDGNDLTQDICPTGWRLPTGSYTGEYKALYDSYAVESDSNQSNYNFAEALSLPHAGTYGNTNYNWSTYYWTSTHSGTSELYTMGFDHSYSPYLGESNPRYRILVARCVYDKKDINSVTYLQDINPAIIKGTAIGAIATLKDKRDNEEYKVGKLADGNVWLLENLRLDISTVPLENLQGNTNAPDDALNYLKNGGGTSPYAVNAISTDNSTLTNERTSGHIQISYKDNEETNHANTGTSKIGVYYNYCAASAGTYCSDYTNNYDNSTQDICPAGWRLPTNAPTYDAPKTSDLRNLYVAYGSNMPALTAALNTIPSYGFYGSYNYYPGGGTNENYLWTATVETGGSMRLGRLGPNPSEIYTGGTDRSRAFSVRCMAKME